MMGDATTEIERGRKQEAEVGGGMGGMDGKVEIKIRGCVWVRVC